VIHGLLLAATLSLSASWKRVAPGVEAAPAAELGGDPSWSARVVLVDPARARFLVRYDASRPTLAAGVMPALRIGPSAGAGAPGAGAAAISRRM